MRFNIEDNLSQFAEEIRDKLLYSGFNDIVLIISKSFIQSLLSGLTCKESQILILNSIDEYKKIILDCQFENIYCNLIYMHININIANIQTN